MSDRKATVALTSTFESAETYPRSLILFYPYFFAFEAKQKGSECFAKEFKLDVTLTIHWYGRLIEKHNKTRNNGPLTHFSVRTGC